MAPLGTRPCYTARSPVIMTNANGAGAFEAVASLPHIRVVAPEPAALAEAMIHFIDDIEAVTTSGFALKLFFFFFFFFFFFIYHTSPATALERR